MASRCFYPDIVGGLTKLIEAVIASPSFEHSSKLVNHKMETPLHLAVKPHLKKDLSTCVLKCLLQTGVIDPSAKSKNDKRPRDYILAKDDQRFQLLSDAMKRSKKETKKETCSAGGSKGRRKGRQNTAARNQSVHQGIRPAPSNIQPSSPTASAKDEKPKLKEINYNDQSLDYKLKCQLRRIYRKDASYFVETVHQETYTHLRSRVKGANIKKNLPVEKVSPTHPLYEAGSSAKSSPSKYNGPALCSEPIAMTSCHGEFSLEGLNFDVLPWEVEVTRNVVKFFKNTKRYSPTDRISAARVIYAIAEGKRNKHLAKPVSGDQQVSLYEARISDAGRILWEKAISFSKKLTKKRCDPTYSQVIRVREVILDHDNLDRKIKYCADQIIESYHRGCQSSIRWGLKCISHQNTKDSSNIRGEEKCDHPFIYTKESALTSHEDYFVPAASTNKSEYSVTTFYSLDTISMKSMITGSNEKRDYPFKEWQKENEVIGMNIKEAILLLGRSGTGKTTCCLYRLWNEFKDYWAVKIPHKATSLGLPEVGVSDSEVSHQDDACEDQLPAESSAFNNTDSESSDHDINLHQLFVTKNYVLCDQMRKRFYCMVAGCDFLEPHLQFEEETPPNSFSKSVLSSFPYCLTVLYST